MRSQKSRRNGRSEVWWTLQAKKPVKNPVHKQRVTWTSKRSRRLLHRSPWDYQLQTTSRTRVKGLKLQTQWKLHLKRRMKTNSRQSWTDSCGRREWRSLTIHSIEIRPHSKALTLSRTTSEILISKWVTMKSEEIERTAKVPPRSLDRITPKNSGTESMRQGPYTLMLML